MKKALSLILALALALSIAACGTSGKPAETPAAPSETMEPSPSSTPEEIAPFPEASDLFISAAASLAQPLDELVALYNEKVGPKVRIIVNYGGSGALQTQIENGSPADLFLSAAAKQMDALQDKGLVDTATRVDLLKNDIVLIVPATAGISLDSFEDAAAGAVGSIALGDPESVPAGQYAKEVFTSLGLWEAVQARAVFASDVKQVLSWVATGNADCGVVYKTDAVSESGVKIAAAAPEGSHKEVIYPAAVLATAENRAAALSFLEFLQTDEALGVFERYGFTVNR